MFLLSLLGCPTGKDTLTWYTTCGDPVCDGYTGPFDGVDPCTSEAEGDGCDDEGVTCDPADDCNALLVCATEDPKDQTGGCPISRASAKRDIHYLSADERAAVARQALDMPLATWSYRWDPPARRERLGFIIDDQPTAYAVDADGQRVDLYGYTSLALAATQEQDRRLADQERRIAALEAVVRAQSEIGRAHV